MSPDEKFEVKICVEEAAIIVASDKDPKTSCAITLTSPVMREENTDGGKKCSLGIVRVDIHINRWRFLGLV